MARLTPTTRTIRWLEAQGWLADIVERQTGRVKHDLFGMFDVLAIRPCNWQASSNICDAEVLVVQVTDHTSVSKRVRKIEEHENIGLVRKLNWRIQVHGWYPDRDEPRVVDVS